MYRHANRATYRVTAALVGLCTLLMAGTVGAQVISGDAGMASEFSSSPYTADALYPLPNNASAAIMHGRYLAMAGDCAGCHTVDLKQPFAGGFAIGTPFGTIFTSNITPDPKQGIGGWSFDDFYKAMHEGISPKYGYLYPAFPFPGFSQMPKQDVRDLWQYLKTLPASSKHNRDNELGFPYSWRGTMFVWRILFFRANTFKPDPDHDAQWNRGAYLTNALGHCGLCHSPRGSMGQVLGDKKFSGSVVDHWLAPNITGDKTNGLGNWSVDDIAQYLHTGSTSNTSTLGGMRRVVQYSLQFLKPEDRKAIAVYLKSQSRPSQVTPLPGGGQVVEAKTGKAIYEEHCATCHLWNGKGYPYAPGVPGITPPLAGNPVVTDTSPRNTLMAILQGEIEPNTMPSPLPYAMPGIHDLPSKLTNKQIAAVANYIRNAWGNDQSGVSAEQVKALRDKIEK